MILQTRLYFPMVTANQSVTDDNIRLYNYNSGHPDIQIWQTIKASAHFGDSTNALLMEYPKVRDFCSYSSSTDDTPAGLIARAFAQGYFSVRKVLRYIAQSYPQVQRS